MTFDEPINVSEAAFDKAVLQSKIPVLVDFWAPWCVPCKMVDPILKRLAREFSGKALVAKINTDDYPELAVRFDIMGIPTTIFFSNGEEVGRETGAHPEKLYRNKILGLLS